MKPLFTIDASLPDDNMNLGMALLRKLFWVAVFLISTLCFVVLFEHGTDKFADNLSKQVLDFRDFAVELLAPPKTEKGS